MKLTKKWLEGKDACLEGVEWFMAQKETDSIKVLKKLIKENRLDWANWLIVLVMKRKQYLAYAIYSAELVLENFEKEYPDDKRPRKAIEAAKLVLKNNTEKNRSAAWSAGSAAAKSAESVSDAVWSAAESVSDAVWSAAESAAESAWSAVWSVKSAESTARSAAKSAVWSVKSAGYADDAWSAARSAARSAVWSAARSAAARSAAARSAMLTKILNHGIELLTKG